MFEEYDKNKVEEARKILSKVYEYYYGEHKTRKLWKRLETIISKIEELQEIIETA